MIQGHQRHPQRHPAKRLILLLYLPVGDPGDSGAPGKKKSPTRLKLQKSWNQGHQGQGHPLARTFSGNRPHPSPPEPTRRHPADGNL